MPWGREAPPAIRLPRIPFLGCVGQIIKLAVILLILLALGTCWFFSGGGIVIGDGAPREDRLSVAVRGVAGERGCRGAIYCTRGSVSVNVLPSPTTLSTVTSPFIARERSRLMESPRPVPSWVLVSDRPS